MPLILVVEQDEGVVARLRQTLGAEGGWRLQHVRSAEEAMQRVAAEAPDLFVVSTRTPGAASLLGSYARRQGGPGTLALIPDGSSPDDPAVAGLGADAVLAPPVSGDRVREAIEGILHSDARPAASAPAKPASEEPKLTSHDIFGDLVAEVEREEAEKSAPAAAAPPATAPTAPAAPSASATPPPTSAPRPADTGGARPARSSRVDDEIERRLEQTLSGVFPDTKSRPAATSPKPPAQSARPAPPAGERTVRGTSPPPPRRSSGQSDVDALISKTLSGLETPRPKRPARPVDASPDLSAILQQTSTPKRERPEPPTTPRPAAPRTGQTPGQAPGQASAQPPDSAKSTRPARPAEPAAFDFSDLEDLARTPSWRRSKPVADAPPLAPPGPAEGSDSPDSPGTAGEVSEAVGAREARDTGAAAVPPPGASQTEAPDVAETSDEAPVMPATGEAASPPPFTPQFAETIEEVPDGTAGAFVVDESPAAPSPPATAGERSDHPSDQGGVAFGQYRLLERIGVGGMAEVWKARMTGVEGFQKTVAIKKILPHLTDSSDFVDMFVDEAKLAAQLNHAHIIHIYDLGRIEGDYYIAMEYVEGENLRAILNAARERGRPLPVGLALHVAARLASALDYAHRKRDFEDKSLELVHRDVSPQNVLIGYEGTIKLCDFGIVKAVSKTSHTRMGALKGKLQYMSPEQAWGRNVDGRSDIFSLGALLFEMLTGRRLFSGDSEMEVLEAVRECRVQAPGALDPSVPEEVDAIVLKALAREPDDRFQTAGELERQIDEALVAMRPSPGQSELAAYMTELFERGHKATAATAPDSSSERDLSGLSDLGDLLLGTPDEAPPVAASAPEAPAAESLEAPAAGSLEAPAAGSSEPPAAHRPEPPATPGPPGPSAPTERGTGTGVRPGTATGTSAPTSGTGTGVGVASAHPPGRTSPAAAPTPDGAGAGGAVAEAAAPVEAIEPVAEVEPEEGGGKGKGLLIAAIAAAVLLAVLLFWFVWLPRLQGDGGDSAPPQTPTTEESPDSGAAKTQGEQPVTGAADAALPAQRPEGTAGAATAGLAGTAAGSQDQPGDAAATGSQTGSGNGESAVPPEVEEQLEEALAKREETLRKEFEQKQRELAARVEAAKARAAEPEPAPEPKSAPPPTPQPKTSERAPAEAAGPSGSTEPQGTEAAAAKIADGGEAAGAAPRERQAAGSPAADKAVAAAGASPAGGDTPGPKPAKTSPAMAAREPAARPERKSTPEPAAPPKPSVQVGQLVQMGPGVVPPQLVTFEKPEYPPIARRLRVQGEVVVGVLVDENGNVADARLERSVPQKVGINEAALKAARQATYRPATKDGVRVKMWTTLKIPFRL